MTKYEIHPLANLLPRMTEPDNAELQVHMKEHGQLVPIVLYEGKILDGRNRYRACVKLGIEPRTVNYSKKQAREYVKAVNLLRRHYSRSEKREALIRFLAQEESMELTHEEAAEAAGVSKRTIQRIRRKRVDKKPVLSTPAPSNGQIVDSLGTPVPKLAQHYWNRRGEAREILNMISKVRVRVEDLLPDDPMWSAVNLNGVKASLNDAYNRFAAAVPEYVCPDCKGVKSDDCGWCKGKGVVGEFIWRSIPKEIRRRA